jgi:hypothetical protein
VAAPTYRTSWTGEVGNPATTFGLGPTHKSYDEALEYAVRQFRQEPRIDTMNLLRDEMAVVVWRRDDPEIAQLIDATDESFVSD